MKVGDPVEVRWDGTTLGVAHIADIPAPNIVVIKGAPRVVPTRVIEAPRDHLVPNSVSGWVLDLAC